MTPYQQAIAQINQKYSGTTTASAPAKAPGIGGQILNAVKGGMAQSPAATVGLANNFFSNLSTHLASFGESALSPVTKGLATAGRAIQATPDVLGAGINLAQGNTAAAQGGISAANQTMNAPVNMGLQNGVQPTLGGSTPVQNLGTAAQAASFLVPETGLGAVGGGAVAGGLQTGGQAAENPNATAGGVAGATALGTAAGAGLGAAAKYGPELLSKAGDIINPKGTSALHLPGQNIFAKISPEQQAFLSNETQNIPFGQGDMPHLTPVEKLQSAGAKEVSLDEFKKASPNAKSALDKFNSQSSNPYDVNAAQAARESASNNAIKGINDINQTTQSDLSKMGQEFEAGAQKIDTSNPKGGLELSSAQLDALNNLKESKKFSLPSNLDSETNPLISNPVSKDFLSKNAGKLSEMQNAGKVKLNASQAQDLIKRLNKLTFDAKASGDLAVNQQTIGLTNELKASASKAFGSEWDNIYSKYSAGRGVLEKLDGIINLDKNASPTDLMKQFNTITKLHETPEGEKLLSQAVEAYKAERGIDLTDPVQAANQVLKSQGALEIAQKGSYMTQLKTALKSPNLAARRVAMIATTIAGISVAGAAFRKQIVGMFTGQ